MAIENVCILDTLSEDQQTNSIDAKEANDPDQIDLHTRNGFLNDVNSKSYDELPLHTCDTDDQTCTLTADSFENLGNVIIYESVVVTTEDKLISNELKPDTTNGSAHEEIITQSCDLSNHECLITIGDDFHSSDLIEYVEYDETYTHSADHLDSNDIPNIVANDLVIEYNELIPIGTEPNPTNEFLCKRKISDENPPQSCDFSNVDHIDENNVSLISNDDEFYSSDEIEYIEEISVEVELDERPKSVSDENESIPCRLFELPKYLKPNSNRCKLICNYCQKCFRSKNILQKHIRKHTKQSFKCTKCDRCFVTRSSLVLHEQVHSSKKSRKRKRKYNRVSRKFFCSHCTFKCTAQSVMTAHTRTHDIEKKFLPKSTSIRSKCISDRVRSKSCTSNQSFSCDKCGKTFTTSNRLGVHRSSHTCERLLNCTKCQFRAKNYNNLKYHISTRHSANEPMCCEFCGKLCDNKFKLREHLRNSHKVGKQFICDICDRKYKSKATLIAHIRSHMAEKPFVCEICNQKYAVRSSLIRHKRFQHGADQFVCDYCQQTFGQKNTLRKHIQEHLRQLNRTVELYKCQLCELEFTERSQLKNHACITELSFEQESIDTSQTYRHIFSTNVNESLHLTCQICDFKVDRDSDLMDHFRLHTGETPFFCEICEERFARSMDLSMHKLIYHD